MSTQPWPPVAVGRTDGRWVARVFAGFCLGAQAALMLLNGVGGSGSILWTQLENTGSGLVVNGVPLPFEAALVLMILSVSTLTSRLVIKRPAAEHLAWLSIAWVVVAATLSLAYAIPAGLLVTQLFIAAVAMWGCRLDLGERRSPGR
jgi:hypothetical protein